MARSPIGRKHLLVVLSANKRASLIDAEIPHRLHALFRQRLFSPQRSFNFGVRPLDLEGPAQTTEEASEAEGPPVDGSRSAGDGTAVAGQLAVRFACVFLLLTDLRKLGGGLVGRPKQALWMMIRAEP